MNHMDTIAALNADLAALTERRAQALAELDAIGQGEREALALARKAYAAALAEGETKAIKQAAIDLEHARAAVDTLSNEEERLSLLVEGLLAKIEALKPKIEAAERDRVQALGGWLTARASKAAAAYLRAIEAARVEILAIYAVSPLLQYQAGLSPIARGQYTDVLAPVANMPEFRAIANEGRKDNPLRSFPDEFDQAQKAIEAEARALGLLR